ncbi:MAG: hypothetical protein M1837_002826 [Sclerophora amabilis]|nr:MAG: hypothetical protein M1837_002826 [Sclerophora amabilis]
MFPGVAQRPQSGLYPYDQQAQPYYNYYNSGLSSPGLGKAQQPQPYGTQPRAFQAGHRLPQQFAYPLVRTNSSPGRGHFDPSSQAPSQAEISEHMLRRKTPNGTLAAGYDGTPVEWASKPHAMKYILLPASGRGSNAAVVSGHGLNYEQPQPQQQQQQQQHQSSLRPSAMRAKSWSQPALDMQQQTQQPAFAAQVMGGGREENVANWIYPSPCPPVMDSILNQVPIQPASLFFWPEGQIPTVLQPMYQPSLGPTTSNGQGPFGPYWPDGDFIPYRPAARSESRFYSPHEIHGLTGSHKSPQGNAHFNGWNHLQNQLSTSHHSQQPQIYPNSATQMVHHDSIRETTPARYSHPQPIQTHAPQTHQMHPSQHGQRYPLQDTTHFFSPRRQEDHHQIDQRNGSSFQRQLPQGTVPDQYQTACHDLGAQSANGQFKDKVLSWAHKVYVDLLASLHQSRKNSQTTRNGALPQHPPKPGIWPRPPRQPRANFSEAPSQKPTFQSAPTSDRDLSQRKSEIGPKTEEKQPESDPNRSRALAYRHPSQSFSGRLQKSSPEALDASGQGSPNRPPSHSMKSPSTVSAQNRLYVNGNAMHTSTGSAVSPIYPQSPQLTSSPSTNAMAALELVTKLFSESCWKWTDGMLLGGCLAYGLGDYAKALRWYSKILEIDSNHVEAISNLAATLLSLNRREEAEQYWLRSVKLRPSYFEAVEHLIGLLCGDHRGSEAVTIIEFVERSLKYTKPGQTFTSSSHNGENDSETSRSSSVATSETSEMMTFDYDLEDVGANAKDGSDPGSAHHPGFGSSGYAIPGSENGRILALVHAKGNMLYALGDNRGAAQAFEDAVLIGAGRRTHGIQGLIQRILHVVSTEGSGVAASNHQSPHSQDPILLPPDKAILAARLVFPNHGDLPGLRDVPGGMAKKAAVSTTSNSLLSLAKIFQDGMSSGSNGGPKATSGVRDILALYYLSLALQPSPSTANNVGILLAGVQQSVPQKSNCHNTANQIPAIPGVIPGSGIALALAYYNFGLNLDSRHAHLYTNLGSLLKDIGQLTAAIKMYEQAVACDGNFDIALANLANAVKDQGKISDAIGYYKRAVLASPDFAEAVCGLANALNSVCAWAGRGGIVHEDGKRDRWHVNEKGMLVDAKIPGAASTGWIKRVVDIVEKQLRDGENWGKGLLQGDGSEKLLQQLEVADSGGKWSLEKRESMVNALKKWMGQSWEGARMVRIVERAAKRLGWHWYRDKYIRKSDRGRSAYTRPQLPTALSVPAAPTVLPFHTFTCPLTARQIRMISQRNGLRISCSTLGSPWLPSTVISPPSPPNPQLNVGYVSSDFNNHPLAHLMQSVFGFHNPSRVKAFCYATTASDGLEHRKQIEREAPVFHDASSWSADRLVKQITRDGIHILINLNGYTRGARNEVFAARPAPIQMSFMGFAGTMGAEWCDYLLADETAIPRETLRPWRRNIDLEDLIRDDNSGGDQESWVYSENIIFARDTFFCCDHRQSAPDAQGQQLSWNQEQARRWEMRKQLFPHLTDDAIILGNFNQLYKIEPSTFRSWLRILARVPKAILWLLRFPDLGENNLKQTALLWAGPAVANRIIFTDVAPKHLHISRARVCDLFLDTPECNAHTTAADVLWSGTPLLTFPRYDFKMCSRMAASILKGALPKSEEGRQAARDLIATSEEDYEERAERLANELSYSTRPDQLGRGQGRLIELRELLYESRWTSALFDTRRWVRDLEEAYEVAWGKWVAGEGGDIWL